MSSIIQGYSYDIFISYRQKDNKYDGWVTEFVDNLKRELDATFKEDVSIYFDENPSGRLRSIEFIFSASGVNRPLTPSDNPDKNLNKTFYRDQINKVANTIKDIIY